MRAGVSNEDDLTIKLGEMLQLNSLMRVSIEQGLDIKKLLEHWQLLQYTVAQYINSETPGLPLNLLGNKHIRALCQRLKGKHGRFRGNLSGKRVDFSGRTVISPDPNVEVDQVVIPVHMAKIMTFPERVSRSNFKSMQTLVRNGPNIHPGANFVEKKADGHKFFLAYSDRSKVASLL